MTDFTGFGGTFNSLTRKTSRHRILEPVMEKEEEETPGAVGKVPRHQRESRVGEILGIDPSFFERPSPQSAERIAKIPAEAMSGMSHHPLSPQPLKRITDKSAGVVGYMPHYPPLTPRPAHRIYVNIPSSPRIEGGHLLTSPQGRIATSVQYEDPIHLASEARAQQPSFQTFTQHFPEALRVQKSDLTEVSYLAGGVYGDVYKCYLVNKKYQRYVAVKYAAPDSEEAKIDCLSEAYTLSTLNHPNVVSFIGVVVEKPGGMGAGRKTGFVMELCGENLLGHVRSNTVTFTDKIRYCLDIVRGLQYIHSKNVIHRDLGARNCLIALNGDVKLSDFGRSVIAYKKFYQAKLSEKQAISWAAPEALTTLRYTPESDIFSVGVVFWEIYSDGEIPYTTLLEGMGGDRLARIREFILRGGRLNRPIGMPKELDIMTRECWQEPPPDRPAIDVLVDRLSKIRDDVVLPRRFTRTFTRKTKTS